MLDIHYYKANDLQHKEAILHCNMTSIITLTLQYKYFIIIFFYLMS